MPALLLLPLVLAAAPAPLASAAALPPPQVAYMTASDGVLLYTETYLPSGAGPWPAILVHSPYRLKDMTLTDYVPDAEYVGLGYALVIADVRGTGNSGGCFDMMGAREQRDSYELVEWVAAQAWSTGKVGMKGISYPGTTPHEAAILAPPHLAAVVTAAGVTNQWRNVYRNGVPIDDHYYPATYLATVDAPPSMDAGSGEPWARSVAQNGCGEEQAVLHRLPTVYEKGVYDAYWAERNLTRGAANVTVPILYSQGFADDRVFPVEALGWFNEIPATKRAFIHQGGHGFPTTPSYQATERAWFEYWLKGVPNGVLSTPLVQVESNIGGYRAESAWPPAATTPVRSWLAPGALVASAPAAGTQTYVAGVPRLEAPPAPVNVYNPPISTGSLWRSVTSAVTGPGNALLDAGVKAATGSPTRLSYLGDPLATPLHLSGTAKLHLRASSSMDDTYLLASLYDVHDGAWTEVSVGWLNAHLREGFDHSAPLTPGVAYGFEWAFEPDDHVFAAGHQVGLRLLGSDERAWNGPLATNTVQYGDSWLELPTV